jgi:selenocysteine lyase/cysteine desulfurase
LLQSGKGRVKIHTSLKAPQPLLSCGIATVEIDGLETPKLQSWLWDKHRILTVAIKHDEFNGLRITPSVYTSMQDLDRFCAAVEKAMTDGLPTA